MNRHDQIKQAAEASVKECPYINTALVCYDHFVKGAEWADAHPSPETINRIVQLYKEWYTTESSMSIVEYVKQHWNDER